ncbi:hypothetical protein L1049_019878 [Liquidambar formosana]|uniref:Uncharacterized protein n=1 Tax=Liquidambar formosana TaxID=63359 RepID=A0AAP0X5K9_LIQFO
MAETAVSLVVDKLVPLLAKEVKLLKGVRKDVEDIKNELDSIRSFLKDADARAENGDTNESLKTWVKQVREIAYHIEDVVDEYMLRVASRRHRQGFIGFLYKVARLLKKLKISHEIASEIQDIKISVRDVKDRSLRYNFDSSSGGSSSGDHNITWHDPRVASLFIEESELVGIESPRNELISFLEQSASKRTVISVAGMGGLGKTTLAKKVYDNQMVRGHFDCHAWIAVSQSYKMEDLLRKMIKQFYEERKESTPRGIDTMEGIILMQKLREYLEQKRYVIVFDDVWGIDFWRTIKHALPDNNKGSRIIITTRSDDVALSCKESPLDGVHKLQPLPEDRAWELFCKKAFQSGVCPQELEVLSHEIVGKCEGLPLAIVAIGGLLSTKIKDVSQWKKLLDSLGSEMESNPHLIGITRILSLSYHALPYFLKSCFLYFGIYPEDYSINCMRLIRLWIAEGFVKEKRGKTLEEVAQDYLTELIHRSLVQVSWVDFDGKARSCRVHDLMHEIILSKSEDLSFCRVVVEEDSSFDGKTRRISIHDSADNVAESICNTPIRSIFLFEVDKLPKSLIATFIANFKFLKALDFADAPLDYLPEEVGNLFHLRYLSVRNTKVKMLPKSIGKLYNLQTLDLKRSLVHELPIEINQLCNLRYLSAYYFDDKSRYHFNSCLGVKIQEGIGCLEALQKLCYMEVNHGIGLISELSKLRQLRKLGILKLTREHGRALCASIEKMKHLQSLQVNSISADEILDMQHIPSPPPFLRYLGLVGRLAKLPDWIAKLQNVVKLTFNWTRLTIDPLKVLQALPNLLKLNLYDAYEGEQLHFVEGGFQKLKVLTLFKLNGLKSVIIDKGALPLLGELAIGTCPQLETVPSGIHHLRNLTTLYFIDMPKEFTLQMKPNGGQLYWIVEHIPAVSINYEREKGGYDTYPLR